MPVPLDYQSPPALTPAQKRAAAHLLACAVTLWVAAASFGLIIVTETIDAFAQLRRGATHSVVFQDTIAIIVVAALPAYGLWRVGRIFMRARRGLPAHQPAVLTDSIGVLDVFQLITLIASACSFLSAIFFLVDQIRTPSTGSSAVPTPAIAAAVSTALLLLVYLSRRQLHKVEQEMSHTASGEPPLPPG